MEWVLEGHPHQVWFVAFYPDGTHMVSGSGTSNKMTSPLGNLYCNILVFLFDIKTLNILYILKSVCVYM